MSTGNASRRQGESRARFGSSRVCEGDLAILGLPGFEVFIDLRRRQLAHANNRPRPGHASNPVTGNDRTSANPRHWNSSAMRSLVPRQCTFVVTSRLTLSNNHSRAFGPRQACCIRECKSRTFFRGLREIKHLQKRPAEPRFQSRFQLIARIVAGSKVSPGVTSQPEFAMK